MSGIRSEVLQIFKKLHQTRKNVFQGDSYALNAARVKINEGFRQNIQVTNEDEIRKMITLGKEVEEELRTNVIQAKQKDENLFEIRITPDTTRLVNVSFNPDAEIEEPSRRGAGKKGSPCCGGTMQNDKSNETVNTNKI